jgi:group I intron endonuclease
MDVSNLVNPGLYKITCFKNNKSYINQSSNILSSLRRHVDNLEEDRHDCLELQKDFDQYGKQFFQFESLEINKRYLDESFRKQKENQIIQKMSKQLCYNKINLNTSFFTRSVKVEDKKYSSLSNAARVLKY